MLPKYRMSFFFFFKWCNVLLLKKPCFSTKTMGCISLSPYLHSKQRNGVIQVMSMTSSVIPTCLFNLAAGTFGTAEPTELVVYQWALFFFFFLPSDL